MYCKRRTKRRTKQCTAQHGSADTLQNAGVIKHRNAIIALTVLLLIFAGSVQLIGAAPSPTHNPTLQLNDMSRDNFAAFDSPFDCTTAGCHQQIVEARWVHAPASTNACLHCHTTSAPLTEHQFNPTPTDDSSCIQCHTFDQSSTSIHEPFQLGNCHQCHDPHASDRKSYILADSVKALCITCHDQKETTFSHHPVATGDCQTCHNPHQSKYEMLLSQPKETLCLSCHQGLDHANRLGAFSSSLISSVSTHQPLVKETCLTCHLPHGSDQPGILIQSQRALCIACHDDLNENLPLALSVHSPYTDEQSCTQCHNPHDSQHESLLAVAPDRLCMTCHDQPITSPAIGQIPNMKKLIEESAVVHEPVALGQCTSCHKPHFSTQHNLLQVGYPDKDYARFEIDNYAMCIQCHDQIMIENKTTLLTAFRDQSQNLHFVHINREKGRSCSICHQPHAGELPKLMRKSFPFGPGAWELPIGFTQTPTGGSCISACHEQRTYDNTIYNFDTP